MIDDDSNSEDDLLRHILFGAAALALALAPVVASAGETLSYTYDARGQLVKVTSTNGRVTKYEYDAAGNRTKVEATAPASSPKFVVLPLLGGLLIPVN